MSDWREGFNRAMLAWLTAHLAKYRHSVPVGIPAEIIDISERIDHGFGGSDVTAGDDPEIELTITWRDTNGIQHVLSEGTTLTQLMKELDA